MIFPAALGIEDDVEVFVLIKSQTEYVDIIFSFWNSYYKRIINGMAYLLNDTCTRTIISVNDQVYAVDEFILIGEIIQLDYDCG